MGAWCKMKRVVVTGMGLISSVGNDLESATHRLRELKNTVHVMPELTEIRGLNTHLAAPATDFELPEHYTRKVLRTMGRYRSCRYIPHKTHLLMRG